MTKYHVYLETIWTATYDGSIPNAENLAKQAAENTRKGLKSTARSNFGNKVYAEADRAISDISRIKKLAQDRATKPA
jgi:hypothetical protein